MKVCHSSKIALAGGFCSSKLLLDGRDGVASRPGAIRLLDIPLLGISGLKLQPLSVYDSFGKHQLHHTT